MLLSALFTYRVGPVLHVDLLSHFSHVCLGKKIEILVSIYIFFSLYAKINMSHKRLTADPLIFLSHRSNLLVMQKNSDQ